jgi:uncharacterized protein (DUF885 family)
MRCPARRYAYPATSVGQLKAPQRTRERAIQYYMDTLGEPEKTAITQIERYCVWPGQACAYMLGKSDFLAQRARAQKQFAAKFDIRKFHDAMLLPGAVPLELLEQTYA